MNKYFNSVKYILIIAAVMLCGLVYAIGRGIHGADDSAHKGAVITAESEPAVLTEAQTETIQENPEEIPFYVYVCGCVVNPGVYTVKPQTRVYELIELAGGFAEAADESALNLVDFVTDGQKVYVPKAGEIAIGSAEEGQSTVLVNINTADKAALMTLPGIGESKAEEIMQYRKSKGAFQKIEDIKNISGIKEAAFNKMKDLICV